MSDKPQELAYFIVLVMFDLRKIFDLRKFFAVPRNFLKSKIYCTYIPIGSGHTVLPFLLNLEYIVAVWFNF